MQHSFFTKNLQKMKALNFEALRSVQNYLVYINLISFFFTFITTFFNEAVSVL